MQCSQRRGGEYDGKGGRERETEEEPAGDRTEASRSRKTRLSFADGEEDAAAVIRFSRGDRASCAPGEGRDVDLVGWVGGDVNMVRSNQNQRTKLNSARTNPIGGTGARLNHPSPGLKREAVQMYRLLGTSFDILSAVGGGRNVGLCRGREGRRAVEASR